MKIPRRQDEINAFVRGFWGSAKADISTNGNGLVHTSRVESLPMSDERVIELCRKAKNAAKFSRLFDHGELSDYDGDDSDADAGLLGIMSFYTKDYAQLERLWGMSALGRREKFRREDYRRRTINYVLDDENPESYSEPSNETIAFSRDSDAHSRSRYLGSTGMSNEPEPKLQAVSFRGQEKPGPREWLVDKAIALGHAATWYGEGGIAKSLIAGHLGISIAQPGIDWWAGLKIKTAPVLYEDFELDHEEHLRRSQEIARGMGLEDVPEDFYYLPLMGMPTHEAFAVAREECIRLGAKLFVVDSVGFALDGDSEVSRDVLGFHKQCLQPIKEVGTSPLLIDHQAKVIKGEKYGDKQEFGSVYKTNSTRSSFQIRGSWDGSELTTTFTHKKTNFGPKVSDFSLKVVFGNETVKIECLSEAVPNPDKEPTKKELVFEAVEELGRATAETEAKKTGLNLQTVRNAFSELLTESVLVDTGDKQQRSRIVVTHSQSTKGTGTGTKRNTSGKPLCPHNATVGARCHLCPGEVAVEKTVVVNIKDTDKYDVYIGHHNGWKGLKDSIWKNPYKNALRDGFITRKEAVDKYRAYILGKPELLERLEELWGKRLGCWCVPDDCHGQVLVELLEEGVA